MIREAVREEMKNGLNEAGFMGAGGKMQGAQRGGVGSRQALSKTGGMTGYSSMNLDELVAAMKSASEADKPHIKKAITAQLKAAGWWANSWYYQLLEKKTLNRFKRPDYSVILLGRKSNRPFT